MERLFDLEYIEEMSGGNAEFVDQMLELYLQTVPESIDLINKYYTEKNYKALGKEAHKLKSTILTVRVPCFEKKIKTIEQIGKQETKLEQLPELMNEFNSILPESVSQIRNELHRRRQ